MFKQRAGIDEVDPSGMEFTENGLSWFVRGTIPVIVVTIN